MAESPCFICAARSAAPVDLAWYDRPVAASENGHAFAVPALGALSEGHVLVVPARHVHSVQVLEAAERAEFIAFLLSIIAMLRRTHAAVTVFEHGACLHGSGPRSACIDHAHVQVLSGRYGLDDLHPAAFRVASLAGFYDARPPFDGYIAHQDAGSDVAVARDPGISQYYRQQICAMRGEPDEWDYWVVPRLDVVRMSCELFERATAGRDLD